MKILSNHVFSVHHCVLSVTSCVLSVLGNGLIALKNKAQTALGQAVLIYTTKYQARACFADATPHGEIDVFFSYCHAPPPCGGGEKTSVARQSGAICEALSGTIPSGRFITQTGTTRLKQPTVQTN